jgi:probable HAF family extracellular repeat protein
MNTVSLKSKLSYIACFALAVAVVSEPVWGQDQKAEHPYYILTDIGTLQGGTFSQGTSINDKGLVTVVSTAADNAQHAALFHNGSLTDISKHLPPGTNSGAFASNIWGQVLVEAEIPAKDPNNENFCAYGTPQICRAFLWQNGVMAQLPTLGGPNTAVGWINNVGEAVGFAETSVRDPECPSAPSPNGTGPQVLDFEAVIWGPRPGQIRKLTPISGDTVSMAFGVNDLGQVVGGSGRCADTLLPGPSVTPHAVLWENGNAISMGSLGGTVNTDAFGVGTIAFSINNRGEAVGAAALPGNATSHAFLWSKKLRHMLDLGTVPGDVYSAALGTNNEGDVIGASFDADGNPRAYVRKAGASSTMMDLNELVPADSPLYLLVSYSINDLGEIAGFGVDGNGDLHGFLVTPCDRDKDDSAIGEERTERPRVILSEHAREMLRNHTRLNGLGPMYEHSQ